MENIPNSDWKTIPGFPKYAITPDGQVWSYYTNKFLKPHLNPNGYLSVRLYNDLGVTTRNVHRLVGKAFIPLPEEFKGDYDIATINHKDHSKTNNHYTNLEWVSLSYNSQEPWDNGYMDHMKKKCFCVSIEDKKYTPFDSARDMDRSLSLPTNTVANAINITNGIIQGKYIVGYTENLDQKYLSPKPDAVGIIQLYSDAIANFRPRRKECFLIDSLDDTYKAYKTFNSYASIDEHLNLPIGTVKRAICENNGLIQGRYIVGDINDSRWKKILAKCTVEQIVALYAKQIERYKWQRGPKKITNLQTGESDVYNTLADFAKEKGILPTSASNYLKNHSDLYRVELA